jgi:pilus assembly protein Flp/PilA
VDLCDGGRRDSGLHRLDSRQIDVRPAVLIDVSRVEPERTAAEWLNNLGTGRRAGLAGRFFQTAKNMLKTIVDLCRDQTAATAIEYGLIAALIPVAAVTVLSTVGSNLTGTFSTVARKL